MTPAKTVAYRNEGDVKKQVKKLLTQHGYFFWMPAAGAFGKSGTADICSIKNGVFLAVETKFGKNTPTAMQRGFLESINAAQGFGFVVCEKRVGYFAQWLGLFDEAAAAQARGEDVPVTNGAAMLECMRLMTEELVADS
jgi:hypothetical protein